MKRYTAFVLAFALLLCTCGCSAIEKTGPKAPEIKIERKIFIEDQYMQAKEAIDCSEIVAFIDDLNEKLYDDEKVKDYDLYYDKEAQTVYVTSAATALAFKLDSNGHILFTSCTGPYETKVAISQGIAKTYASSFSSDVEALFATVEAQTWLNDLNSSYINKAVSGFSMKDLDTSLTATQPDVPELKTYNGFPTITEALDNAKLMDLENYFESPTLKKFWKDVDISSITGEIKNNDVIGDAIRDQFNNTTVTAPDTSSGSISSITNPTKGTDTTLPSEQTNSNQTADTQGNKTNIDGGVGQGFANITPSPTPDTTYDPMPPSFSEDNPPI